MISVVIPLYNLGHRLSRAVESVQNQTYSDWEAIIVDDGSIDDSGMIADQLSQRDKRIRVIHQENRGLSGALNVGCRDARGSEFIILSADDMIAPTYMARTRALMQGDVDIVSTDMCVSGGGVKCIPGSVDALRRGNCHAYAALYKRELFERTGGYKDAMTPSWEDYEFWVSCLEVGAKWAHVSTPLFGYTPNPNGRGAEARDKERLLRGKLEGYHPKTFGEGQGLVTFVIPLFEQEQWVRYAASSALGQSYPHVRVVVVNDASPTYSPQCLEGLDCVVLHHKQNLGLSAARNTGISYAHNQWASQYFVCLDADDGVAPEFVEEMMGQMAPHQYAYCDVQFIGDAWHTLLFESFECRKMLKKHQHPCTFLAETQMWHDVVRHREFGYDEGTQMRIGHEDIEFALACLEVGWCGQHIPGLLFEYRYHADGSMRSRASQKKKELSTYIRSKHPWLHTREGILMACKNCGGRGTSSALASSGSEVPMGAPLMVTYLGNAGGKLMRLGRSGKVYRMNRDNRVFFIDSGDVHLFEGPFKIEAIPDVSERVEEAVENATTQEVQATVEERDITEAVFGGLESDETEPQKVADQIQQLPGVGPATVRKLKAAGFTTFEAIGNANAAQLTRILPRAADVEEVQANARLLATARR